jgi:hypothetical protein
MMSSPSPTARRSSRTATTWGLSTACPSSCPAAPEERITESAPLWRSRWTFSASRAEATIVAAGLSSRAVRVTSTALSSRSLATMTAEARSTSASSSTVARLAEPWIAANPPRVASSIASRSTSMTRIWSGWVPAASSVAIAARPLVPKPQTMVWSFKRCLQSRSRTARRVLSVSTSIVVPTRMMRNTIRAGVMSRVVASRDPSVIGVMSP